MSSLSLLDRVMRKTSRFVFQIQKRFDRDFSPLFICGIAGSGTTLLSALMDQRYQVAANVRESARWSPPNASLFIDEVSTYPDLAHYRDALPFARGVEPEEVKADCIRLYQKHVRWPKQSSVVLDKAPNTHLVRAQLLHTAFPKAKFLLIVRDPVANIEGLRRKWPLFGDADLSAVCDFWQDLHQEFIDAIRGFSEMVQPTSYSQLVQEPDALVARAADFAGLMLRDRPMDYQDTRNTPGKGLRNVKQGEIEVDKKADADARARLPAADAKFVHTRLGRFYEELEKYCSLLSLAKTTAK